MGQQCYTPISTPSYSTTLPPSIKQFLKTNINRLDYTNKRQILQQLQQNGFYHLANNQYIMVKKKCGLYFGNINQRFLLEGKGKLICFNSTIYQGNFANDVFQGAGQFYDYERMSVLTGHWQNGIFSSGKLYHQSGIQITFYNLQRRSKKKYYSQIQLPNKLYYKGYLIKNKQNGLHYIIQGKGFMKFPDGSSYDGEWCQGLMDGSGKYIWDNGNYYHGNYSKGKRNGKGTMFFYKANLIYHGFWIDGEPRQQSIVRFKQYSTL